MDNCNKSLAIAVVCCIFTAIVVGLPKDFIPLKMLLVMVQLILVAYSV